MDIEPRPFGCVALFGGIAIVIATACAWHVESDRHLKSTWPSVPGVITHVNHHSTIRRKGRGRTWTTAAVDYVVGGNTYTLHDDISMNDEYHDGDRVTVRYWPQTPAVADVDEFMFDRVQGYLQRALLGTILFVPSLAVWLILRSQRKARARSLRMPATKPPPPLSRRQRRKAAHRKFDQLR